MFTYNSAISCCAKGTNWQAACEVFQCLVAADLQPDTISFSSASTACERASLWPLALGFLQQMLSKRMARPDVIAISGAMSACEKAGRWQIALYLLSNMEEYSVSPDVVSFGSAICACVPWLWILGNILHSCNPKNFTEFPKGKQTYMGWRFRVY